MELRKTVTNFHKGMMVVLAVINIYKCCVYMEQLHHCQVCQKYVSFQIVQEKMVQKMHFQFAMPSTTSSHRRSSTGPLHLFKF